MDITNTITYVVMTALMVAINIFANKKTSKVITEKNKFLARTYGGPITIIHHSPIAAFLHRLILVPGSREDVLDYNDIYFFLAHEWGHLKYGHDYIIPVVQAFTSTWILFMWIWVDWSTYFIGVALSFIVYSIIVKTTELMADYYAVKKMKLKGYKVIPDSVLFELAMKKANAKPWLIKLYTNTLLGMLFYILTPVAHLPNTVREKYLRMVWKIS